MGYRDYTKAISESEQELSSRLKKLSLSYLRDRCEVFLWLKTGRVRSMRQALILKNKDKDTGTSWWRLYEEGGLDLLLEGRKSPHRSELDDFAPFWERLENEGFSQIKEAQKWLKEEFNLTYTENGLGNYMRQRRIKLKTGRPHHPKKDEVKRAVYKKNMRPN